MSYEVTVGNIGSVFETKDTITAEHEYHDWCAKVDEGVGKAAWEEVTLWEDGEPVNTYKPPSIEETRAAVRVLGVRLQHATDGPVHQIQEYVDMIQAQMDYLKRREA